MGFNIHWWMGDIWLLPRGGHSHCQTKKSDCHVACLGGGLVSVELAHKSSRVVAAHKNTYSRPFSTFKIWKKLHFWRGISWWWQIDYSLNQLGTIKHLSAIALSLIAQRCLVLQLQFWNIKIPCEKSFIFLFLNFQIRPTRAEISSVRQNENRRIITGESFLV